MARKNEVVVAPSRKPGVLVPIFGQAGDLVRFDLCGRVCVICSRNDLPTAALMNNVVAVDRGGTMVPAHRYCAESEAESETEEDLRQSAAEAMCVTHAKISPAAQEEIDSPLFVPEGMPVMRSRPTRLIALAVGAG